MDGDVDQSDLGIFGPLFGLHGETCDNPFPEGSLSHSATRVDNSSVRAGDDHLVSPEFDGGVTHFTFDISVDLSGGSVWTTTSLQMLLEPAAPYDIFHSPIGQDKTTWNNSNAFPAVLYDTAFQAPQDMGEGNVGTTQSEAVQTADEFAVDCWFSIYPVPITPSDGLIARLSIVRTGPGGEPIIIPAGACPSATRIGSVIVNTTHAFTDGQLHTASYEIIENPLVGDINGDLVVDTADLGALIAEFGQSCP